MTHDPYRPLPTVPRYRLQVNGELVEGDCFRDVIRGLRRLGYDARILDAVTLVVQAKPGECLTLEDRQ